MSEATRGPGLAKAGVNLFKKLVYENHQTPVDERRSSPRDEVIGEVTVTVLDEAGQEIGQTRAFVRDMSKGGCGIWSRIGLSPGASVMLTAPGPGGKDVVHRMGKVRHCRGSNGTGFAIGIRFDSQAESVAA